MKIHYITMSMLAGVSVVCSSCVSPSAGYASYTVPTSGGTFSAGVSWTDASYDSNGFPIFGYSNGQPVYGYTASGAAIFSIAALTALCFVPHWSPASWYHGPYHYPKGIHRVSAPPKFPSGHRPHMRPHGGLVPPKAPAHPGAGMHHNVNPHPPVGRPAPPAPKPSVSRPAHKGGFQTLPQAPGRGVGHVPAPNHKPAAGGVRTLPAPAGRAVAPAPAASKKHSDARPLPAPAGRVVAPVPSASAAGHKRHLSKL